MTQKLMSLNDVVIVTVGRNDQRIHIWSMAKSQAVNKMKLLTVVIKVGSLKKNLKCGIIVMKNNAQKP